MCWRWDQTCSHRSKIFNFRLKHLHRTPNCLGHGRTRTGNRKGKHYPLLHHSSCRCICFYCYYSSGWAGWEMVVSTLSADSGYFCEACLATEGRHASSSSLRPLLDWHCCLCPGTFIFIMHVRYYSSLYLFTQMRYEGKPNPARSSSFKINFHFQQFAADPPALTTWLTILESLKGDLFPYLRLVSLSSFLIVFQIIIFTFLDPSCSTIKPHKGIYDILPWLLSPFASQAILHNYQEEPSPILLCQLMCHVLYVMFVITELQYKLKNNSKLLILYIFSVLLPNIFLTTVYARNQAISCNNASTYALYAYLLLLNNRIASQNIQTIQAQYDSEFSYRDRAENGAAEFKEDRITELYKFVVMSYMVFLGAYGEGCQFSAYLIVVFCIFALSATNII